MNNTQDYVDAWHRDEREWWNKHGEYMTYQWRLTPTLHRVTRSALERDYVDYLYTPGGRLLDVGCGSGWLSLLFARKGMSVVGLDIAQEQIDAACQLQEEERMPSVRFECADFTTWDDSEHIGSFDSIFVNAFLHHLPEQELERILNKIARVVRPGGRVFMYEPLTSDTPRRPLVRAIDRVCNLGHRILNLLPARLGGHSQQHRAEVARGYTMNSPHERPVNIELLRRFCEPHFQLSEVRGWHLHSIGFAMHVTALKPSFRRAYEYIGRTWYVVDRLLLATFGWQAFSMPNRFILCGIKLIRR